MTAYHLVLPSQGSCPGRFDEIEKNLCGLRGQPGIDHTAKKKVSKPKIHVQRWRKRNTHRIDTGATGYTQ